MRKAIAVSVRMGFSCFVLAVLAAVVPLGCKPSIDKIVAREEQINRESEALLAQIQDMEMQGQSAEAVILLDKVLKAKRYEAHKGRFFSMKIDLLLSHNNDAAAGDLVIAAWHSEPALARCAFDRLYTFYQQNNKHAAILVWCRRLFDLGTDLPYDVRPQILNWQLTATLAAKNIPEAQICIDSIIATLKPDESLPLFQQAFESLLGSGQCDVAAVLINHIADKPANAPLYSNLVVTYSLRCVLAKNDWEKFPAAFQRCVTQLPDDQLSALVRTAFSSLQRGNQKELIDQSCKYVIFNAIDKVNTVNFAARLWVENGVAADKKLLPERLDALLNAKVSPILAGDLYERYFYDMVGDLDIVRGLCAVGDRILSVCNDETTVNNVKVKVLDGAFILDNFDLAVQMLEQGIPGKDKAWHAMSLPKVKAHRALAQKKPREAVKYFREFMNAWLASDQEEEYDPTSGIAYSREWILGRNANRIANILDAIPDKAEAAKARDEAKAYFRTALEKAKNDADAMKLLKEETKRMAL